MPRRSITSRSTLRSMPRIVAASVRLPEAFVSATSMTSRPMPSRASRRVRGDLRLFLHLVEPEVLQLHYPAVRLDERLLDGSEFADVFRAGIAQERLLRIAAQVELAAAVFRPARQEILRERITSGRGHGAAEVRAASPGCGRGPRWNFARTVSSRSTRRGNDAHVHRNFPGCRLRA